MKLLMIIPIASSEWKGNGFPVLVLWSECVSPHISHVSTRWKWVSFTPELLYSWQKIPQCLLSHRSLRGSQSHSGHLGEKTYLIPSRNQSMILQFSSHSPSQCSDCTVSSEGWFIVAVCMFCWFWIVLLCLIFSVFITLLTFSLSNRSHSDGDCISCGRITFFHGLSLLKALLRSNEWSL
jgi:hypothetical protein